MPLDGTAGGSNESCISLWYNTKFLITDGMSQFPGRKMCRFDQIESVTAKDKNPQEKTNRCVIVDLRLYSTFKKYTL